MTKYFFFSLCVFIAFIVPSISTAQQNTYTVKYLPANDFVFDGHATEADWKKCKTIASFISPWSDQPIERTVFRAAYDEKNFYFLFEVSDSKVIVSDKKYEIAATEADRVEIFFTRDTLMNPYYCFEIAPNGIVCDYKAKYHREFSREWNATDVRVKTSSANGKYFVEGAIPLALIKEINGIASIRGASILAGVFRGDKDVVSTSEDDITWISWIRPKSAQPDFHIPSSFGFFKFE